MILDSNKNRAILKSIIDEALLSKSLLYTPLGSQWYNIDVNIDFHFAISDEIHTYTYSSKAIARSLYILKTTILHT